MTVNPQQPNKQPKEQLSEQQKEEKQKEEKQKEEQKEEQQKSKRHPPPSQSPLCWRIWHSLNYFCGSCFLLVAALISCPSLGISTTTSAIFYSLGSLNLVIADSTELLYEAKQKGDSCVWQRNTLAIGVSLIGSLLYFVGSVLFVPSFGKLTLGENLIIAGSICIGVSQLSKIASSCQMGSNVSALLMDGFSLLGAMMFIVGTVFLKISYSYDQAIWVNLLVSSYSLGGAGFLLSAIFLVWKYFCTRRKIDAESQVELGVM